MKGTYSPGNTDVIDLYIPPGLEFQMKFICPGFKNCGGKCRPYAHLRVSGVTIAQYGNKLQKIA